ncbi:methyltransferase [Vibrio splendidus]|nr:methyltransferase [Vibrio splendidus]PTP97520.1 methyltransferase [Vibrio splendidus]
MTRHDRFDVRQEFFRNIYVSVQKSISNYCINAGSLKQNEVVLNHIYGKQQKCSRMAAF